MKLKSLRIRNFRSYNSEVTIDIDNLTVFVGENDIGKSTILEALDIFFNDKNAVIKLDENDFNKTNLNLGDDEIIIAAAFTDLPKSIVIDSTNETYLANEFLLNRNGDLEIIKKYVKNNKNKIFIKANHPTNSNCKDLLLKKDTELKKIITDNGIECSDKNRKAQMRSAIWNYYSPDLQLDEIEIDVSKEGDVKSIWTKLNEYLPLYFLFQSDRRNNSEDNEIQDPLKTALEQILKDDSLVKRLNGIARDVESKLKEVSERTLEKLREMNPEIADTLNPVIPAAENLKWSNVFKVSITGDQDIPINKRGSGIKRLILLNFFRAEAERKRNDKTFSNIIYAIEEPETGQHTANQKLLVTSLISLSEDQHTQVILTTHSANIIKKLDFHHLRLIQNTERGKIIQNVSESTLTYPSLNEINYVAFAEVTEEYHNELYGFLEFNEYLVRFKENKETMVYKNKKNQKIYKYTLTEYIRHQIHHPENDMNEKYTNEQLAVSISLMREFIHDNKFEFDLDIS